MVLTENPDVISPGKTLSEFPEGFSTQIQRLFSKQLPLLLLLQKKQDGVMICDTENRVLMFNQALQNVMHLSADILYKPCSEILYDENLHQGIEIVLSTGKSVTTEIQFSDGKLKKYFKASLMPLIIPARLPEDILMEENPLEALLCHAQNIKLSDIIGCVVVFHDITAIKRTEKMRRDFVANVSHELRTPLSAIKGYAETLLEGGLQDEDNAEDFVEVIHRHSIRLTSLVDDLLDLSKMESPDFEPEFSPTDLESMIDRVMLMARDSAQEKNIELVKDIFQGLPKIKANPSNLEQVLTNLMDNAIKYTPDAGTITVSVHRIDTEENGEMIQVNVKDTGMGVDPKHIPRLFERFYRVDKARFS